MCQSWGYANFHYLHKNPQFGSFLIKKYMPKSHHIKMYKSCHINANFDHNLEFVHEITSSEFELTEPNFSLTYNFGKVFAVIEKLRVRPLLSFTDESNFRSSNILLGKSQKRIAAAALQRASSKACMWVSAHNGHRLTIKYRVTLK